LCHVTRRRTTYFSLSGRCLRRGGGAGRGSQAPRERGARGSRHDHSVGRWRCTQTLAQSQPHPMRAPRFRHCQCRGQSYSPGPVPAKVAVLGVKSRSFQTGNLKISSDSGPTHQRGLPPPSSRRIPGTAERRFTDSRSSEGRTSRFGLEQVNFRAFLTVFEPVRASPPGKSRAGHGLGKSRAGSRDYMTDP